MKMKSFAVLAMSGLLAASVSYTAPALADDDAADVQAMQTPGEFSSALQNNPTLNIASASQIDSGSTDNDNNANSTNNSSNSNDTGSNSVSNSPSSNDAAGSGDEGVPDTATGDDDY